MQVTGLHHVSIMVSDVETAARFYVNVLGLKPRTDRPDCPIKGMWLDAGGQQVHLVHGPEPTSTWQHFALRVVDLDATVCELRIAGYKVPEPVALGSGRQTSVHDPCGNVVELTT